MIAHILKKQKQTNSSDWMHSTGLVIESGNKLIHSKDQGQKKLSNWSGW